MRAVIRAPDSGASVVKIRIESSIHLVTYVGRVGAVVRRAGRCAAVVCDRFGQYNFMWEGTVAERQTYQRPSPPEDPSCSSCCWSAGRSWSNGSRESTYPSL